MTQPGPPGYPQWGQPPQQPQNQPPYGQPAPQYGTFGDLPPLPPAPGPQQQQPYGGQYPPLPQPMQFGEVRQPYNPTSYSPPQFSQPPTQSGPGKSYIIGGGIAVVALAAGIFFLFNGGSSNSDKNSADNHSGRVSIEHSESPGGTLSGNPAGQGGSTTGDAPTGGSTDLDKVTEVQRRLAQGFNQHSLSILKSTSCPEDWNGESQSQLDAVSSFTNDGAPVITGTTATSSATASAQGQTAKLTVTYSKEASGWCVSDLDGS